MLSILDIDTILINLFLSYGLLESRTRRGGEGRKAVIKSITRLYRQWDMEPSVFSLQEMNKSPGLKASETRAHWSERATNGLTTRPVITPRPAPSVHRHPWHISLPERQEAMKKFATSSNGGRDARIDGETIRGRGAWLLRDAEAAARDWLPSQRAGSRVSAAMTTRAVFTSRVLTV